MISLVRIGSSVKYLIIALIVLYQALLLSQECLDDIKVVVFRGDVQRCSLQAVFLINDLVSLSNFLVDSVSMLYL